MHSPLTPLSAEFQCFSSCFRARYISYLCPVHSSHPTQDVALETTASRTRVYPHSSSGKRSCFRNIFFKVTWTDNGVAETQVILKACQAATAEARGVRWVAMWPQARVNTTFIARSGYFLVSISMNHSTENLCVYFFDNDKCRNECKKRDGGKEI